MNKPVHTRAQIRRAVCSELNMRFYKRFDGYSELTGGTTTAPTDSDLTQASDFWNGSYLYIASSSDAGFSTPITDFTSGSGVFTPEIALPTAPTSGSATLVQYEITDLFSPIEIHRAINRAIIEAFPSFYDVAVDRTLVLQEDKLTYDLTSLTNRPWVMMNINLEDADRETGVATSAGSSTFTDSVNGFSSDVGSGWLISIYDGTGAGQLRTVNSRISSEQIDVTVDWTTTPDTTSKYAVWNPSEETLNWLGLSSVSFDQKEYPSQMRLGKTMNGKAGNRFELQYSVYPSEMTADSDETVVPLDYLVHKTIAYLAGMKINDNRADRQKWSDLEDRHSARAEVIRRMKRWQPPDITRWTRTDRIVSSYDDNPLDW